jgi:hypothetical protein
MRSVIEARRELANLVMSWLHGDISTEDFDHAYWRTRGTLINESPGAFAGVFGREMDAIDGAVDARTNDPATPCWIPETQMREEVESAMNRLQSESPELFE